MRDPVKITVTEEEPNLEGINQFSINVTNDDEKNKVLQSLLTKHNTDQAIIFCDSKLVKEV